MNTSTLALLEMVSGDDPAATPVASIIVLHGLGADGNDFVPIAHELDLGSVGPVRFVFPSAPVRPVTINGDYVMRAWYDIYPPSTQPAVPRREDDEGLRASQALVQALLDREAQRGATDLNLGKTLILLEKSFSRKALTPALWPLRFRQICLQGVAAMPTPSESPAKPTACIALAVCAGVKKLSGPEATRAT